LLGFRSSSSDEQRSSAHPRLVDNVGGLHPGEPDSKVVGESELLRLEEVVAARIEFAERRSIESIVDDLLAYSYPSISLVGAYVEGTRRLI